MSCLALVAVLLHSACGDPAQAGDPADARRRMLNDQIAARGVRDPLVLAAMGKVPRHEFVPPELADRAYADQPLPIGSGQTISQPYIVAAMTELARIDGRSRVLEIGTGSGYQAAVLAEIASEVYSIEIIEELADQAKETLARLGYERIQLRTGDGYAGWPEAAPFDAILVTAAAPRIPPALLEQLAPDGRLIIPTGSWDQELQVHHRTAQGIEVETVFPVRFVPMTGEVRDR